MAYRRSTNVDMMTLPHDKYIGYSEQLYRKILPSFKQHIPIDIMDEPVIAERLMLSEMEKIRKKEENCGRQAGAFELLYTLHTKPNWFSHLMEAMKSDTFKLHDLIPKFEGIKDEVDREWLKRHPETQILPSTRSALIHPVNASYYTRQQL